MNTRMEYQMHAETCMSYIVAVDRVEVFYTSTLDEAIKILNKFTHGLIQVIQAGSNKVIVEKRYT